MVRGILTSILLLILTFNLSWSQHYQFGLELSPTFDFQLQSSINNTWSIKRGKGFLFGFFFDKIINEHSYIGTAAKFEYSAFNQKSGDILISSFRILSVNVPVTFKQEIGVTENWFYNITAGINYNFLSRQLVFGNWVNVNNDINRWQPYINIGVNYFMASNFEIGMHTRFHPNDLWTKTFEIIHNADKNKIIFY